MLTEIILLHADEVLKGNDLYLAKLANFMGLKYNTSRIVNNKFSSDILDNITTSKEICLALNGRLLANLVYNSKQSDDLKSFLYEKVSYLFIYGTYPGELEDSALQYLSEGAISSLSFFDNCNNKYEVSSDLDNITRQLSGISFGPINKEKDFFFERGDQSKETLDIISINKKSTFLSIKIDRCEIFFVACSQIVDIDKQVARNIDIKEYFSQLIPAMMFFKYVFKDMCWHNDNEFSNFIIDDPLLQKRYGFLKYNELIEVIEQYNFALTIAFISWNSKRTNKDIAKLFQQRPDKLTIAVHGYDHTKGEFGETNYEKLNHKIKLASDNMQAHKHLTGVNYDNVMIFPQGIFSKNSMKILKCNNYMSAVNSTPFTVDSDASNFKISDLLEVAILNYENFPLFLRRYPRDVMDFAFDLFLGKPILIVEHHHYFKNGNSSIINFIKKINSISEKIKWKGLGYVIENSYLEKSEGDGEIYCKIFTNRVIITNKSDHIRKYTITKNETNNVPIKELLVNNQKIPYAISNNWLSFSIKIGPKKIVKIIIIYENIFSYVDGNNKLSKKVKVYLRRYLSELRDNVLCKSDFLLAIAYKIKNLLLGKI